MQVMQVMQVVQILIQDGHAEPAEPQNLQN